MSSFTIISFFTLIFYSVHGGLIRLPEDYDESNPFPTLTSESRAPLGAPEKVDKSTELPSTYSTGLFDLQKIMEMFNSFARNIFAPFQQSGGGSSPFNLRLPTLAELFPSPLIGRLNRQGLQVPEQRLTESFELPLNRLQTFQPLLPESLLTLPTFAPLTIPEFRWNPVPTLAPINNDRCVPRLAKEFKENETYFEDVQQQVDQADIDATYDIVLAKAAEICTTEQVERLKTFMKKYEMMKKNIQELAPEYPKETRDQVLKWLRSENYFALNGFISKESMANLFNAPKNSKLMQTSFQLTSMQIDLFFNPI